MLSLQCAITRDLIDNSDPGYTRLKQQLEKNNFCLSIQKHWQEEEEREIQMQRVLRYTQTQTEIRVTRKSKNWNDKLFSSQANAKKLSQS